jgi:hypothetical protein
LLNVFPECLVRILTKAVQWIHDLSNKAKVAGTPTTQARVLIATWNCAVVASVTPTQWWCFQMRLWCRGSNKCLTRISMSRFHQHGPKCGQGRRPCSLGPRWSQPRVEQVFHTTPFLSRLQELEQNYKHEFQVHTLVPKAGHWVHVDDLLGLLELVVVPSKQL